MTLDALDHISIAVCLSSIPNLTLGDFVGTIKMQCIHAWTASCSINLRPVLKAHFGASFVVCDSYEVPMLRFLDAFQPSTPRQEASHVHVQVNRMLSEISKE